MVTIAGSTLALIAGKADEVSRWPVGCIEEFGCPGSPPPTPSSTTQASASSIDISSQDEFEESVARDDEGVVLLPLLLLLRSIHGSKYEF